MNPDRVRRAYVGLGSNLDDPIVQVRRGIEHLHTLPMTRCLRASSLYRTLPWGRLDQPAFINAVAELDTTLTAKALLDGLLSIEVVAGRVRDGERWGPRVLDLDLLLYGDDVVELPGLSVPHPHLQERVFVLLPLAQLAPTLEVPGRGRVSELLARTDNSGCERLDDLSA